MKKACNPISYKQKKCTPKVSDISSTLFTAGPNSSLILWVVSIGASFNEAGLVNLGMIYIQ